MLRPKGATQGSILAELSFMVRVIRILSDFKMVKSILIATDISQQNSDEVRLVIPSTLEEEDKTSLISKS